MVVVVVGSVLDLVVSLNKNHQRVSYFRYSHFSCRCCNFRRCSSGKCCRLRGGCGWFADCCRLTEDLIFFFGKLFVSHLSDVIVIVVEKVLGMVASDALVGSLKISTSSHLSCESYLSVVEVIVAVLSEA